MTSFNGQAHLHWLMVARTVGLCAITSFCINTAHSHDQMRPELNAWFKSLKNKAGQPCCDGGDGQYAEAEWDTAKDGYRVLLTDPQRPSERGQWFDVPKLCRARPAEPQRQGDGLVVAVLRRGKNDSVVALLHSRTGRMIFP